VLPHVFVGFALGLAEALVVFDVGDDGREEGAGVLLFGALVLKTKRVKIGALVVSVVVSGVPD